MRQEGGEVYRDMQDWSDIRRKVLVEGVSKREILRLHGLHWKTLEKILEHPVPPGYRRVRPRPKPKLEAHLEWDCPLFLCIISMCHGG